MGFFLPDIWNIYISDVGIRTSSPCGLVTVSYSLDLRLVPQLDGLPEWVYLYQDMSAEALVFLNVIEVIAMVMIFIYTVIINLKQDRFSHKMEKMIAHLEKESSKPRRIL